MGNQTIADLHKREIVQGGFYVVTGAMSGVVAEVIDVFSTRDGLGKCLRTVQYVTRFVAGSGYNKEGVCI